MSRMELVRSLQSAFKKNAPPDLRVDQPSRIGFYYGYDGDDGPITRAAVYLTNRGCPWKLEGAGCGMCDLSSSLTPKQIAPSDFMAQIRFVVAEVLAYESQQGIKIPELDLYNDGSGLNPKEIPSDVLCSMLQELRALQLKRVVLESLPEFVTSGRVQGVVESASPAEVVIAMGIETFSEVFRTKVLTKPSPNIALEKATRVIREAGAVPRAYVLLKPPMMSEGEAVADAIAAIRYCQQIGIREVSLEPVVTGNSGTLQNRLNRLPVNHPYHWSPPWLWSILKVLLETRDLTIDVYPSIFTTPYGEMPFQERSTIPHNCEACSQAITDLLADYHRFRSIESLETAATFSCDCKSEWEKELDGVLPDPFEERGRILSGLSSQLVAI